MADQYTMKKHPVSDRLTPQQETAVDLIVAGQNDSEGVRGKEGRGI